MKEFFSFFYFSFSSSQMELTNISKHVIWAKEKNMRNFSLKIHWFRKEFLVWNSGTARKKFPEAQGHPVDDGIRKLIQQWKVITEIEQRHLPKLATWVFLNHWSYSLAFKHSEKNADMVGSRWLNLLVGKSLHSNLRAVSSRITEDFGPLVPHFDPL